MLALLLQIPDHPLDKATDFIIDFIPIELILTVFVGMVSVDLCYGVITLMMSFDGEAHVLYTYLFWTSLTLYALVFLPKFIFNKLIGVMFPGRSTE